MDINQDQESSILNEVTQTAVKTVNDFSESLSPADKKAEAKKKTEVVTESMPKLKADASMANDQGTNDSTTLANAIASAESKPVKKLPQNEDQQQQQKKA